MSALFELETQACHVQIERNSSVTRLSLISPYEYERGMEEDGRERGGDL